jgi:serine/threonine-protein kinase
MSASTQQEVRPASHFVPGISPALDGIILELLRLDPEQRTPSGEVLQRQLMALTGFEAPYPYGRQQLIEALREATTQTSAAAVQPLMLTPDMALTEQAAAVAQTSLSAKR